MDWHEEEDKESQYSDNEIDKPITLKTRTMTRKEEINQAANEFHETIKYKSDLSGTPINSFITGAEWADEHPKRLYVVTRCEEHSDYIEKVFVDENKANDYCEQFEGDEDAYGRDITEIDITL